MLYITLSRYVTDSVMRMVALLDTLPPPAVSATQEYVPDPDLHK